MRSTLVLAAILFAACSVDRSSDVAGSAHAQLVSPDLVIANLYAGGGNVGATYNQDFVVVFNRGAAAAPLTGIKLFYASSAADFSAGNSVVLGTGSLDPGESLLVGFAMGANGASITADVTAAGLNLGASAAKLALSSNALSCGSAGTQCDLNTVIDLVGWGTPSQVEGTTTVGTSSNTKALERAASGCTDTGDNSADFALVTVTAPRSSTSTATPCGGAVPGPADLSGYTLLLNEVKWNPSGSDNGQEYVELIGSASTTIPANTYVLSVEGDGAAGGRINYVKDVSGKALGSNGLLLIKATATAIAGIDAVTTVVDDTVLNGLPLQNGTESVLLIWSPTPLAITAGTTNYTALPGTFILDSIAAADSSGTTFGAAQIAPCPSSGSSPIDGATRKVGDNRTQTAAAWLAGQAIGNPGDPFLDKVTVCSGGPATWSMSPGRANDMPQTPAPDLGAPPAPDLAGTTPDLGGADLAKVSDLSGTAEDLASDDDGVVLGGADMTRFGGASRGGCAMGGGGSDGAAIVLSMILLAVFLRLSSRD
jgi:hypothetical protein